MNSPFAPTRFFCRFFLRSPIITVSLTSKKRFKERLQKHLSRGGSLSVEEAQKRWAAISAQLDHAIVAESARWGAAWHKPAYTREDWLRMSNYTQNVYFPSNYIRAIDRFRSVALAP